MEVVLTPDVYQLSTDDDGNFYDSINYIKNSVACPCGTRMNKAFVRKKWQIILNVKLTKHGFVNKTQTKVVF